MKTMTIILSLMLSTFATAQYEIDFENFNFPDTLEYDNGSNSTELTDGFFEFYPLKFPNVYNDEWNFWQSGWAISSVKDSVTPGFTNLYAARPGGSYSGNNYAVGQQNSEINYVDEGSPSVPAMNYLKLNIANSTYAALSMRDGDQFAKKFGGETGDDPDYFFVRISLLLEEEIVNEQDIYLADFRFEDNSQDYISENWDEILFEGVSFDKIKFRIFSSDTGAFGINTPTFFCVDKIEPGFNVYAGNLDNQNQIKLFPNPTQNLLNIQLENERTETLLIHDLYGRIVRTVQVIGQQMLDVGDLASGVYFVRSERGGVSRFVKQ
jgi:hypothetical protein